MMNNPASFTVSYDALLPPDPENFKLEQLEDLFEKAVLEIVKQSSREGDVLVRVTSKDGVHFMTLAEADAYLNRPSQEETDELKKSIEKALREDPRVLEKEIRVILLFARITLRKYRENGMISQEEIRRVEPQMLRLARQVDYQLKKLRECFLKINELRHKHPILGEFEQKVVQLLHCHKTGDRGQANELARQLGSIKHQYLRLSRGIESDIQASHSLRINLQRQKKSILSCHRYLTAQREGLLQETAHGLRKNIDNLKILLTTSREDKKPVVSQALGDQSHKFTRNQQELQAVQKEKAVLKRKEDETGRIIQTMESVLHPPGKKPQTLKIPAETSTPASPGPVTPPASEAIPAAKRMVIMENRKNR
ncbi:MAG: hypothetical protein ACE15F_22740 [bacterium]